VSHPEALSGIWKLTERRAEDDPESRVAELDAEGGFTYRIGLGAQQIVMLLRWEVEGETFITLDPDSGNEIRARYTLQDDRLTLDYGGEVFTYERSGRTPPGRTPSGPRPDPTNPTE
jgi:hypothetical protein